MYSSRYQAMLMLFNEKLIELSDTDIVCCLKRRVVKNKGISFNMFNFNTDSRIRLFQGTICPSKADTKAIE